MVIQQTLSIDGSQSDVQIEEALLAGAKTGGAAAAARPPPAKRRRADEAPPAAEPVISNDEDAWNALAGLYRDLGEDHLAHTAFASHVARSGALYQRSRACCVVQEQAAHAWQRS